MLLQPNEYNPSLRAALWINIVSGASSIKHNKNWDKNPEFLTRLNLSSFWDPEQFNFLQIKRLSSASVSPCNTITSTAPSC